MNVPIKLNLFINDIEADAEGLSELVFHFINEVKDFNIQNVNQIKNEPYEDGVKGDQILLGALVIAVIPTFLPSLVSFFEAWTARGENRRLRIKTPEGLEIEFSPEKRMSNDEVLELVNTLLSSNKQSKQK